MPGRLILVGRVAGAFGVKGEVRIVAYTSDPLALLDYRDLRREDGSAGLTLLGGRVAKGTLICRTRELASPEAADALRGLDLYVPREALPAPEEEDEFYFADLIGLSAVTPEGETLGTIKSVQNFGAGDLLEIQPATGASWWLPFTRDAVPEVKIAEGVVIAIKPVESD